MFLFSPAKVNLFFRVLGKRADGYHEIASLYQAIDLGDTLEIELSDKDKLSCNHPFLPTNASNLILKAAHLFRQKTGLSLYTNIHLHKQIPMEAGLGGGSSNAATTLWALNTLAGHPASMDDLAAWSGELGSDISFFFSTGTAYCTGRGEVFKTIQDFSFSPAYKLWIAKPSYGLSTQVVYKACTPLLFPPRDPQQALSQLLKRQPCYFNDLEIPAFQLMPKLATLKQDLLDLGFSHVTMTGSGTAFFCLGTPSLKPHLSGIEFYETQPLLRKEHCWYKTPSFCYHSPDGGTYA